MDRRGFITLAAGLGALALAPGCAPPYRYIQRAVPNPLLGARRIALEPIHFENMLVGSLPEAAYLAGKTPEQQASFQSDKQEFANRFATWMAENSPIPLVVGGAPDPSMMALRPIATRYEPGFFIGMSGVDRPTEMSMFVQLVRVDNTPLDQIAVETRVYPSLFMAASGTRMRAAGENLGRQVATYIQRRVRGEATHDRRRVRRA